MATSSVHGCDHASTESSAAAPIARRPKPIVPNGDPQTERRYLDEQYTIQNMAEEAVHRTLAVHRRATLYIGRLEVHETNVV